MSKILLASLLSFGTVCLSASSVLAQVTSDGTVNTQVTQDGNVAEITGGEARGSNLFHSFQDFSVPTNNEAFFNNADSISNIFSRVTGGNISNIDGLIRANDTNLFLINPAGILFGGNARLDLGGSFYGSTADSILFEDGQFSAVDNLQQPVLTINAPIGLNFRDNPGDIVNNNGSLTVSPGNNISLIGGNINFDGGIITAPGGRVELGGLSAAGTISFDETISFSFPEAVERADISLTNQAVVDVRAGGGGFINLNGRNVTLSEQSELFAGIAENMGSPDAQAGDITINATESVRLVGQPRESILTDNSDFGQIAQITETNNATGIRNNVGLSAVRRSDRTTPSNAVGNGGNITIDTPTLELSNLSVIDTGVFGQGNGGDIAINASEVISNQGIFSTEVRGIDTDTIREQGSGDAGDISIDTESLSLSDATLILTNVSSEAPANAGDVNIQVSDTFVQNTDSFILTQLGRRNSMGSVGSAGDINITAGSYEISERGTLPEEGSLPALESDVSTGSTGDAGNITIDVENNFSIAGNLILTQVQTDAVGNGGDINITAGTFEASDGSLILADIRGMGNAGSININADETIFLNGNGTTILTELGETVGGNAGNIDIAANAVIVGNNANITARTRGQGNAGDITITTNGAIDAISLSNEARIISTVEGDASGNGGNISLETGELNLTNDSEIIADTTGKGDAGNIKIDVMGGDINLNNSTQIQSQTRGSAEGNAGNITIETDGSLFSTNGNLILADSQAQGDGGSIIINAGEQILLEGLSEDGFSSQIVVGLSRESSNGTGGTIEINAGELVLDDVASITSDTVSGSMGNAGNVTIDVNNLRLSENSLINVFTANDFNGGAITINAQTLDLASGGKILAATDAGGDAGNINLNISDRITIDNSIESSVPFVFFGSNSQLLNNLQSSPSGIYADTTENSTGNGGNINIGILPEQRPQDFIISNNGQIIVDSDGTGSGGSIFLGSQALELDNGSISASTQAGFGGTIILQITEDITLRDNSFISAQAFGNADGGNLTIDTDFIVAFPSNGTGSDLIATADGGTGGVVDLRGVEAIFGLQPRDAISANSQPIANDTNDIDASSNIPGQDGTVALDPGSLNPIQGETELPTNIVVPEQTIAQVCQSERVAAAQNSLSIEGKGGIIPEPGLPLNSNNIYVDGESDSTSSIPAPIETAQGKIQLARGVKVSEDGTITLTAYRTNNAGQRIPPQQSCS